MRTLIICVSPHHGSTMKIAQAMREVLGAKLIAPKEFTQESAGDYDMIGFGSGIYDNTLHPSVLKLVDGVQTLDGKKAFLFSTAGVLWQDAHAGFRERLAARNAQIAGEFRCKGFNTNSFLKYIGGMNKGRPNADDIAQAKRFAANLMK